MLASFPDLSILQFLHTVSGHKLASGKAWQQDLSKEIRKGGDKEAENVERKWTGR